MAILGAAGSQSWGKRAVVSTEIDEPSQHTAAAPTAAAPDEAPPASPPPPDAPPTVVGPRRRRLRWPRFGIMSKLLLMLLVTSVVSCLLVGIVGYVSGRDALRQKAFDQLTFVRNARESEIDREYNRLLQQLVVFTRGNTARQAMAAFDAAFDELATARIDNDKSQALANYYANTFVPKLEAYDGSTTLPDVFIPKTAAARYLQAWYTANFNDDWARAIATSDVGDGSNWTKANVEYNGFFQQLVTRFQYDDALLIDTDGNVVYTAYDGAELGTNLNTGPFRDSGLATAFHQALQSNSVDFVTTTDFERFQPSYGVPTAWAVSPVGTSDQITGVMALQIPIEAVNQVMTGGRSWESDGLGETGETYLVGADHLMRSATRLVLEDPAAYQAQAIEGGIDPDLAARTARLQGTVLIQPVTTPQVERALRGESGVMVSHDYFGNEVLAAYAPVRLGDLDWVVVAEIDSSEAFAPVHDFTRRLVWTTAGIIVAVALASLSAGPDVLPAGEEVARRRPQGRGGRSRRPGAVVVDRRVRRPGDRVQRHEPEPADQAAAAGRRAGRAPTAAAQHDARDRRRPVPAGRGDDLPGAPGRCRRVRRHRRVRRVRPRPRRQHLARPAQRPPAAVRRRRRRASASSGCGPCATATWRASA